MAYCTKADLIARGWEDEITGLTHDDDSLLAQAIADSDAEIDSYLVGHIALPLANPSDFLVRKACDIVRFYLYDVGAIVPVVKRYQAAILFLKGIGEGTTMLSALITTPLDPVVASNLIQKPVVTAPAAFFTESLLAKM